MGVELHNPKPSFNFIHASVFFFNRRNKNYINKPQFVPTAKTDKPMDGYENGISMSKERLEAMSKDRLVNYTLLLLKKFEANEVLKMPERSVLMRMASYFLSHMKRPNTAKKAKGKRLHKLR